MLRIVYILHSRCYVILLDMLSSYLHPRSEALSGVVDGL